jgi:hypothetical protein
VPGQDLTAGGARDVIAQGARRRHPGPVELIAGGLVLVLLLASGTAWVLHRRGQRQDVAARDALAQASFSVSAVGVATDHRVALVLSLRTTLAVSVVGATVTGAGWRAVHDRGVGLLRAVDCKSPPSLPTSAAAVVQLHGQRRSVDLLTDPGLGDVVARTAREACGDVDARRALSLKASAAVRVPGGLQLALVVSNRSAHPVTLRRVSVGKLHLRTSKRLPAVLPPRSVLRTVVVLDARGCGAPAGVVGLSVDGRGGPAYLTVASADLPQLAARVHHERCG